MTVQMHMYPSPPNKGMNDAGRPWGWGVCNENATEPALGADRCGAVNSRPSRLKVLGKAQSDVGTKEHLWRRLPGGGDFWGWIWGSYVS